MSDDDSFEEGYARLRRRYVERAGERLDRVETALERLEGPGDVDELETIRGIVHRLAGSGETLGFPEVSEHAIAAEEVIDGVLEGDSSGGSIEERLARRVERMRAALAG